MKHAAAIAALLCLFAVGMSSQPNKTSTTNEQTAAPKGPSTPPPENNNITTYYAEHSDDDPPKWYAPLERPDWWLVFIALLTGGAVAYQAKEMKDATDVMRGQLTAMQGQIGQMESSGVQTTALIAAAQKSADAAKISADIAGRVSIPTLIVEKFELGNMGNANIRAILQLPKIQITLRNYAQTPAFLHSWSLVLTCEELPSLPNYFGHPGSGLLLDKEVIQPNIPYTLPELPSWNRQQFSLDDVEAIIDQKKMFSVYGYVCYGDLFGSPLKRLKFCEFALNIGDNWIQWCDAADQVYCGTDLYPIKGKGTKIEREPAEEKAN
jgi:hypothetical protein